MVAVQVNTALLTDAILSGNRTDPSTNATVPLSDIQKTMESNDRVEAVGRVIDNLLKQ